MKFLLALSLLLSGCAQLQGLFGGGGVSLELKIGSPPTRAQVKAAQKKDQVLINGTPVDKAQYPAVVRITSGDGACTAAVIGPRTILTAAHCAETGQTVQFQTFDGRKFSAVARRAPGYPGNDLDLNLADTQSDIGVKPLPIKTVAFERKGMQIQLIGYGCIKPGGGGGNDGILRTGFTKVTAGQGYDIVSQDQPGGAGLCYGDSGGPTLWTDAATGILYVIGVNSKGNICEGGTDQCVNYTTRLTNADSLAFLKSWSSPICGLSANCDGGTTPPPGPAPKIHVFEDGAMKVQVELK